MNSSLFFNQLTHYNLWANTLLTEVLDKLTTSEQNQEIESSFSSIRKTVFHIWDAEYIWLMRLNGKSLDSFPSKLYDENVAITKFIECSKDWANYTTAQADSIYDKRCDYKNVAQKTFSNTVGEIIQHCMNHSTYHRGQLVTMLRQVGQKGLPSTDFINFLRK